MLWKLVCWLFGHKIVIKEYTKDIVIADTAFERDVKHLCFRFKRLDFCIRCGKQIIKEGK